MADIKFRKYIAEDATTFKALNVEWLELYFEVEPIDERVLSNPQTEILDPGGHILMAELGGKTMGTFAFLKKVRAFQNSVKWRLTQNTEG